MNRRIFFTGGECTELRDGKYRPRAPVEVVAVFFIPLHYFPLWRKQGRIQAFPPRISNFRNLALNEWWICSGEMIHRIPFNLVN
ncbi:MAG: hypothetical protein ACXVMS_16775 [Flavisolibacter sp.]